MPPACHGQKREGEQTMSLDVYLVSTDSDGDEVYSANITHNLNRMADAAGIHKALWRPDEVGYTHAAQLVEPLRTGLALLRERPAHFKTFNPSNGWGSYEGLVRFVEDYLRACEEYPASEVSVSR